MVERFTCLLCSLVGSRLLDTGRELLDGSGGVVDGLWSWNHSRLRGRGFTGCFILERLFLSSPRVYVVMASCREEMLPFASIDDTALVNSSE